MPVPRLGPSPRNRKLRQRRPLRARLPGPRVVGRLLVAAFRASTPALLVVAALVGLGLGAATGHRWLTTSPRFALRDITIAGNARLQAAAILRRAGVAIGQNVFGVSLRATEERLVLDPWIAEAEVRRRLPDGLAIRVVERRPAGLVVVDGAGLYLSDDTGRVFKRAAVQSGDGAGLPVISGLARRHFTLNPALAAALVRRGLETAAAWNGHDRLPLGEVHLDKDGLTLYTLDGAVAVALGRPADAAAALRRFDAAWSALPPDERAQVRTIHLDSRTRPDRVTVSLADPATR